MPRTSTLTYDIVSDDIQQEVEKQADSRGWASSLQDGKMLRMSHRPAWTKPDRLRSGKKLRTRAVSDGTDDVYVWLIEDPDLAQPDSTEHDLRSVLSEA